jgi:hypothetical protein
MLERRSRSCTQHASLSTASLSTTSLSTAAHATVTLSTAALATAALYAAALAALATSALTTTTRPSSSSRVLRGYRRPALHCLAMGASTLCRRLSYEMAPYPRPVCLGPDETFVNVSHKFAAA